MAFYGLDFGTTNSGISIMEDGKVKLLPIDEKAKTQEVVRSALYYYPKKFVLAKNVTAQQKADHTYRANQVSYEGETKTLIGTAAANAYLQDNKLRHPGIKRKIYTGKLLHLILYVTASGKQVFNDILEFYEEIDYGTGRFFHALKSALKVKSYRGSRVFGEEYSL
jgi:molecular chaperone DnaK (HSP70)